MVRLSILAIAITFLSTVAYGQRDLGKNRNLSWKDRIYFGGGGNFNGGTDYFQIGLSPIVGYMITPRLSAGLRASWQNISFHRAKKSINQYGASIFTQYNILEFLFAYGEYGFIDTPTTLDDQGRISVSRLPVGLGYLQRLGERGTFNVTVLYDMLFSSNNYISRSPWIFRVYFTY